MTLFGWSTWLAWSASSKTRCPSTPACLTKCPARAALQKPLAPAGCGCSSSSTSTRDRRPETTWQLYGWHQSTLRRFNWRLMPLFMPDPGPETGQGVVDQAGVVCNCRFVWVHKLQVNFANCRRISWHLRPWLVVPAPFPAPPVAISFVHLIYFNDTQKYQVLLG